tara:strand:+ start:1775 stop:2299 length:525 start_codon:yes stop_codon:yes gene_type:complete
MLKVIDENTQEVQNMLVEEIAENVKIELSPKMMNDNDFFNACDESKRIDGNKINYKLGEWKDNIDDLVKMKTYNDWLLKGRDIDMVDLVRYKMEELALNELKNYPLEYVEFVAREILNIPLELDEIEKRYRAFRKGQRREEKENYRADIDEKKLLKEKNKYLIKKEGHYIIELN